MQAAPTPPVSERTASSEMLSAAHRLAAPRDFDAVVRAGRRAGSQRLVVHLLLAPDVPGVPAGRSPVPWPVLSPAAAAAAAPAPARLGFVVSKAVGNAVVRNRVKRRLRHLARERIGHLPPGCRVVVRALPPAAGATSAELRSDLDRCLSRVNR